jgi:NAD(P)-dependent dehydrogenase (short-subunit alcohol dehydrogenase family)
MEKRIVLVTGASTGIGRACAFRFAEMGYRTIGGVRKVADGESLKAESSGKIEPVPLDVTIPESIAEAVKAVGDHPLAGLINNAGVATLGPVELLSIDAWRKQFDVNVIGVVAVTQAFLPLLRRGPGRIVNIGSIADRCAVPGSGAYDSSKFAVKAITDVLRMELHPWGIFVSLIEAGSVATAIWEKSLRDADNLSREVAPERYRLYSGLMATLREEAAGAARNAASVDAVVEAVEHALIARRPKTRYLVGKDVWLWLMLSLVPDRWRDRLILSKMRESPTNSVSGKGRSR